MDSENGLSNLPNTDDLVPNISVMANIVYDVLTVLLDECIQHFNQCNKHESSQAILGKLLILQKNLQHVNYLAVNGVGINVQKYDVMPGLEANGYRSLLSLLQSLLLVIAKILKTVSTDCSKVFFRANEHLDKLELCCDILHQMRALLYYAQIMMNLTPDGELFIDEEQSAPLMHDCEIMAKACFYGSLHGFQYCVGMQPIMQSFCTLAAQYHDMQQPDDAWGFVKSVINSSRYVISPELRGEKLEKLFNSGDVEMIKKFWFLPEQGIIQAVPSLVGTGVQVNRIFKIPLTPFTLKSSTSSNDVPIHITKSQCRQHVHARLISYVMREGQSDDRSPSAPDIGFENLKMSFATQKAQPRSKHLILFCHGGGFVSLTSKSFEIVLRQWAKDLDCPIFCVDYSLAPEAPFPQAFDECFFAYCWALKNADLLGTTAEKIVFAGDSAGGNLVLSVAMRCGVDGIRMPDSILTIYPACIVKPSVSPARLMSVMDPILPLGVLSGCLSSYAGEKTSWVKRNASDPSCLCDTTCLCDPPPTPPSMQPMRMKYLSNLRKDVEETITRVQSLAQWKPENGTWWDEQFHILHLDEENKTKKILEEKHNFSCSEDNMLSPGPLKAQFENLKSSTSCPGLEFQMKLPHNFKPLKSKFCGDNFQMHSSSMVKNAFMSPALADDDLMKNLPHVDIVASEFDPLLDDSVVLAKRLESLKKSHRLRVMKGLPHGFLTFQFAKEAVDAAALCSDLLRQALREIDP